MLTILKLLHEVQPMGVVELRLMLPPGLTSPSTSVGGKALNPIVGAVEVLGGFVLTAGPPCLGI
jgi:hypothetical protein